MSQGQQADILWTAYIDDQTEAFFRNFNLNMSVVNNGVINFQTNVTNSFNRTREGANRAAGGVMGIAKAFAALHLAYHILGPLIRDLREFATETIEVAASANMLGTVLDFVGQNAGYTSAELEQMVETMNQQGITIRGARQILLEMIQTNLDLATATELAARAQDVARVTQVNSTEAAQRMIHAVATLNPLVLRRMGIIVDFEQAYRDFAAAEDKAWESLSTGEKQFVATQAVLRATEPLIGAYTASLEEVGGQILTLDRLMEDFQVTLGQVFQPAYSLIVTRFSAALIDARHWLEENEEAVEDFGNRLAGTLEVAISLGKRLIELLEILPKMLETVGGAIVTLGEAIARADLALFGVEAEEIDSRIANLGTTAKQAASIIIASFSAGITMIAQAVGLNLESIGLLIDYVTYKVDRLFGRDTQQQLDDLNQRYADFLLTIMGLGDVVATAFEESFTSMTRATGLMPAAANEVDKAAGKIDDTMGRIKKQTIDAVEAIDALNKSIAEDMAKIAIDVEREDFEEAIRLFRQLTDANRDYLRGLEDIRRRHNRQLEDLEEDAAEKEKELAEDQADKRLELAEDHAERRLEIEREYIRDLEDIQRHYVEDVQEAARQNDAVAVARLMRQRASNRRDAAIERDRDLEDEDRDYLERLDDLRDFQEKRRKEIKEDAAQRLLDLQESLEEQLEDAEIARQRELDDMELYNKRRQDDITLQRKWELEDLRAKHQDEIDELIKTLATKEDLSDASLAYLLRTHLDYYQDELVALTQHYRDMEALAESQRTTYDPSGYGWGTPGPMVAPGQPGYYEEDPNLWSPSPGRQPAVPQQPIGGSPYDPPSNIVQHCRDHPSDPVCKWYGLAEGGMFVTTEPTTFMSSEQGQPELVAAIPLNRSMDHNINLSGNFNVSGVSPGMERDISGELMNTLQQFGRQLLAGA